MAYLTTPDSHCPKCRLIDRVEKASVSGRVDPPPEPHYEKPMVYDDPWEGFGYLAGAYIVGSAIIIIIVSLFSRGIAGFGCLVSLAFVFGVPALFAVYNANVAPKRKAEVVRYNTEVVTRNKALRDFYDQNIKSKYEELYYCGRDNVVFDPEEPGVYKPPSEVAYFYGLLN